MTIVNAKRLDIKSLLNHFMFITTKENYIVKSYIFILVSSKVINNLILGIEYIFQ